MTMAPSLEIKVLSVLINSADSRRPLDLFYQGRAGKLFDYVLFNSTQSPKPYDHVGSVHAESAPAVAAGAPKASTVDVIVEGTGNTLWYLQGPKPKSSSGLPRFTGTKIGGGGSTFGG